MLSKIFVFATNLQNILDEIIGCTIISIDEIIGCTIISIDEIIGCTIISISLNYAGNKMNAVQAESSRLWYIAITAVRADRWSKVANCCNRLQWVDCICFGPAGRNIFGYGTVPYPRLNCSKFVGSNALPVTPSNWGPFCIVRRW